jgi:galactokinase/mevalonate kinase-like predicted kinase
MGEDFPSFTGLGSASTSASTALPSSCSSIGAVFLEIVLGSAVVLVDHVITTFIFSLTRVDG